MTESSAAEASIGEAIRALARDEVHKLHNALHLQKRHRGVHESRKGIRRLRASLSLVRGVLGEAVGPIDRALKAMAVALSPLRDAQVVVEMASRQLANTHDARSRSRWNAVRRMLMAERAALLSDVLHSDPAFSEKSADVARLGEAIDTLAWHAVSVRDLKRALKRSLRKVSKAEKHASGKDAADEDTHRWRRRLRRLRMQRSALRTVRVGLQGTPLAEKVGDLLTWLHREAPRPGNVSDITDALGAEQDRRLLVAAIDRLPEHPATSAAKKDLAGYAACEAGPDEPDDVKRA